MNWYYMDGDKQFGPVTDQDIRSMHEAGKVSAETPVWRDGLSDWIKLVDSGLIEAKPAPLPPKYVPPLATGQPDVVAPEVEATLPAGSSLLKRRIAGFAVDVACILLLGTGYSLLRTHWKWSLHLWIGFGRLLMGVRIERDGRPFARFKWLIARWCFTWLPAGLALVAVTQLIMAILSSVAGTYFYGIHEGIEAYDLPSYIGVVVVPFCLLASLVTMAITKGKRGLHDYICRSVAKLRVQGPLGQPAKFAAAMLVIGAAVMLFLAMQVGLSSCYYTSPDGTFWAKFPSVPLTKTNEDGSVELSSVEFRRFGRFKDDYAVFNVTYQDVPPEFAKGFDFDEFEKKMRCDYSYRSHVTDQRTTSVLSGRAWLVFFDDGPKMSPVPVTPQSEFAARMYAMRRGNSQPWFNTAPAPVQLSPEILRRATEPSTPYVPPSAQVDPMSESHVTAPTPVPATHPANEIIQYPDWLCRIKTDWQAEALQTRPVFQEFRVIVTDSRVYKISVTSTGFESSGYMLGTLFLDSFQIK